MPKITRRNLLLGAVLIGGAAAAPSIMALSRPETALAHFLRENVPEVELPSHDLNVFVKHFRSHWKLSASKQRIVLFLMKNPALKPFVPQHVRNAQERQERWMMTNYLLATDFFDGERTGSAEYTDFPDPYTSGCANPLASFDQLQFS